MRKGNFPSLSYPELCFSPWSIQPRLSAPGRAKFVKIFDDFHIHTGSPFPYSLAEQKKRKCNSPNLSNT